MNKEMGREQEKQQLPQEAHTAEEPLSRRQSAPRPTARMEAQQLAQKNGQPVQQGMVPMQTGAVMAPAPKMLPIGEEQVREAYLTLQKYREGKANLEQRVVENEQWFKLRHWECMRKSRKDEVEPSSGWLFNAIANKHADAMDNYPEPLVLPREAGDRGEAEMLSSILPVIMEQNDFEETYDNVWDYKLKAGTGIYGVFWDSGKLHGLGDVSIRKIDIINLFWESGITDIQHSRNIFHVELQPNDQLLGKYPQLEGRLSGAPVIDVAKYLYDDTVDTTGKSAVIDWYYKKWQGGRNVLHYCKFVGDTVLFATENEQEYREKGWYHHGQYPFIFDPLYSVEGTPCGFSLIDVAKSAQEYIDRGNQAVLMNMLANTLPRHFVRADAKINEDEYLDLKRSLVHVQGSLDDNAVKPINGKLLNSIYLEVLREKIDELKEVTGNRDISTGGTSSGVTAASAIAAMQEAGSKLSRDMIKASYRAFRKICLMTIELIRQFYELPRCFRILGNDGTARFVDYSNAGIVPQGQGTNEFGVEIGPRIPLFDIQVSAQKASPYSRLSQNELALQFYGAGFFNPQMADQALACLDMMDFNGKQAVMQKIQQNGTLFQRLMMLEQMMAQMMGVQPGAPENDPQQPSKADSKDNEALGGDGGGESHVTKNARKRVADSTAPV